MIGDKEGFIDRTGRVVIDAQFHGVEDFSQGLARMSEGNSDIGSVYGYIDTGGNVVWQSKNIYWDANVTVPSEEP